MLKQFYTKGQKLYNMYVKKFRKKNKIVLNQIQTLDPPDPKGLGSGLNFLDFMDLGPKKIRVWIWV